MNRAVRISLFLIIVASIAGLIAAVYVQGRRGRGGPRAIELAPGAPDASITRLSYSGTSNGRLMWELTADSGSASGAGHGRVALENVRLVHYAGDGATYTLKGREAGYDEKSGSVEVSGGVDLVTGDGYTLKTDSIVYSTVSRTAATKDPVTITSKKMTVEGVGFRMDFEAGSMAVLKDVRTRLDNGFM